MPFIVIIGQAMGNPTDGYGIVYGWDGEVFADRRRAIKHGLKARGSDDFNIGVLKDGTLVEFCWMNEPMHESDRIELPRIAEELELEDRLNV